MRLEDEAHVLMDCPFYGREREELAEAVSFQTALGLAARQTSTDKLLVLLSSQDQGDWEALGRFVAKVRQRKRASKKVFENMQASWDKTAFSVRRVAWRKKGRHVCRHGVFFAAPVGTACQCMGDAGHMVWTKAKFMPAIDLSLRGLIAVPFDPSRFQRLGQLQAQLRRLGW